MNGHHHKYFSADIAFATICHNLEEGHDNKCSQK